MRTWFARLTLAVLLVPAAGCNIVGPLGVLFAPPQIQKAEVTLTKSRLALLVEYARTEDENPVFTQTFRERLAEILKEKKVNEQLVPAQELARLQQANPDFGKWNLQRVARELRAEQVLYVRIDRLVIRPTPDHPLMEPGVMMHAKLISASAEAKAARLWPPAAEREGRELSRSRPPQEAADARAIDEETTKLAKDAALLMAMPFYDVDKEERPAWEK
jgi:hypothetical protein